MNLAPGFDVLILDACCIISLYASRRMDEILRALRQKVMVAAYVRDVETLRIYGGPLENVQQSSETIDLQPLIDQGLLSVVSETETELHTFIAFAQVLKDDGDAITGAIAFHRGWALATDDRKATTFFTQQDLLVVSTPELVKNWVEVAGPSAAEVKQALQNIQLRARYFPAQKHKLFNWWNS